MIDGLTFLSQATQHWRYEMSNDMQGKIVFFLLNYLALEGAKEHFGKALPPDNEAINKLYKRLKEIGFPGEWDNAQRCFDYTGVGNTGASNVERCWNALRIIRNNLFHANKAVIRDDPDRLNNLLDWSRLFIEELMNDAALGSQAREIKSTLYILV